MKKMTDITELVKRLRASDAHPLSIHGQTMTEAAAALEAQAKEIDDLKNLLMEALERAGDD